MDAHKGSAVLPPSHHKAGSEAEETTESDLGETGQVADADTPCRARKRSRSVLSKEQAIEIFNQKKGSSSDRLTGPSIDLAKKYNVSSKTIRDIWNGRSWHEVTGQPRQQAATGASSRKPGRPKGSKDCKPRQKRPEGVRREDFNQESIVSDDNESQAPSHHFQVQHETRQSESITNCNTTAATHLTHPQSEGGARNPQDALALHPSARDEVDARQAFGHAVRAMQQASAQQSARALSDTTFSRQPSWTALQCVAGTNASSSADDARAMSELLAGTYHSILGQGSQSSVCPTAVMGPACSEGKRWSGGDSTGRPLPAGPLSAPPTGYFPGSAMVTPVSQAAAWHSSPQFGPTFSLALPPAFDAARAAGHLLPDPGMPGGFRGQPNMPWPWQFQVSQATDSSGLGLALPRPPFYFSADPTAGALAGYQMQAASAAAAAAAASASASATAWQAGAPRPLMFPGTAQQTTPGLQLGFLPVRAAGGYAPVVVEAEARAAATFPHTLGGGMGWSWPPSGSTGGHGL